MNPQGVAARIELTFERESVSGRLRVEGEEPCDFHGWLALITALQALAARPGPTRAPSAS